MRSPVIDRHAGVRARIVRAKGPEAALIAHADSLTWVEPASAHRAVAAAHRAPQGGRMRSAESRCATWAENDGGAGAVEYGFGVIRAKAAAWTRCVTDNGFLER